MKLALVPRPVSVEMRPREFRLRTGAVARFSRLPESHRPAVLQKIRDLGLTARQDDALDAFTLVMGEAGGEAVAAPARAEGYSLTITPTGVAIRAADDDGLFWGLVTLQQIVDQMPARRLPCVVIRDYPAFGLRYHHDDISRKQVSTVEDFKRIIRRLSYYKVKYYTPYMEDMLFLKGYPDIGAGRGRLMPAEVAALRAEGRLHNVTVFPTYSLIGHQENLLRNPKYRKYAREVFQEPSSYDPTKAILKPYLRKVIRDVCELFPDAPFFHACFDEVIGVSADEFFAHANFCADEIAKYGKRMLMWADMPKNHWGLERLHELRANVIPVEWEYGVPGPVVEKYQRAKVTPAGLAGYNNWCRFLPDFEVGKRNIDQWARAARGLGSPGFGASMWGDNGYENHRDLAWNLFAYYANGAWTGRAGGADFEGAFQTTFYGRPLPALREVVEKVGPARRDPAGRVWNLFRYSMPAMVRTAAMEPKLVGDARADLKLLTRGLGLAARARREAKRNEAHLDHFTVALRREMNTHRRLLLAARIARQVRAGKGISTARRRAVAEALGDLAEVRRLYEEAWSRHNKRPNIEVSLGVYDAVAASLRDFVRVAPKAPAGFVPLDLGGWYNKAVPAVAGLPLGTGVVNGVPFVFAPVTKTHISLAEGVALEIAFAATGVGDLHIIYGGQTRDMKTPRPALEVELLSGGQVVFTERLNTITQLCDWWAPLGEHMWAGGGFKYVDQKRNSHALSPGHSYGLMHLHSFPLPKGLKADTVRLRRLGAEEFQVFAATVERG